MKNRLNYLLAALVLAGCSAMPKVVSLQSGAELVKVGEREPNNSKLSKIGNLSATHGTGCAMFGTKGTYLAAFNMLKNKAAEMNATYVHILSVDEPYVTEGCHVNRYTIRGVAYKEAGFEGNTLSSQ